MNDQCNNQTCGSPNQVYTYITYATNNLGTAVASISSQLPGNGYQYSYHSTSGYPASHVTVTLPDNAVRDFYFDSAGYVIQDARNLNKSSVNTEYTFFTRGWQQNPPVQVGTSEEFVGEVQEEDLNSNVVRQTTYNYDTAGNVKSVTLCPAPGQTATTCVPGSTPTATWNYSYTTYNLLASAVEPLAYNGVGTTYTYTGTPPTSMTVTDPLGRVTTVDYNGQGQPKSVQDPMGNTTTIQYYTSGPSSGDVEWVQDPIGNTTKYVTDADGRVTSVTSPLQETTQYSYDAIDDVTQVIDPKSNITCNTYDLLGELATTTPPRGVSGLCTNPANINSAYTTTTTRTANLAKTTVTDPLGNSTITNLDGQGRHTDYTDKRGVKTNYTYDLFGRVTEALFNSNNKSGYTQDEVAMSNFDALDRIGTLSDSLSGSTLTYTYDSLDSILSEKDPLLNNSVAYGYDSNGRRTSLQPTMNKISQPTISYGYDCADELVGISNNGTWTPPNCGPSTFVNYNNNISNSAQVAFNLDADGNPSWTLVDRVETVITRDADERVKSQTFGAYPGASPTATPTPSYGTLTYTYDADGHLIDKGGSLAAVNMPAPVATASYSATDQVTNWNGVVSNPPPDAASNIISDPASGLSLTWTARNQLATASGASEVYDGLGRREQSTGSGYNTLDFLHDGGSVLGSSLGSTISWDFLNLPGGGSLAGSYTASGTTTTWVPLIDASGSTIALVNAASTGSQPSTSYTYDPFGNPTLGGTANNWPFLYQGAEKEFTDPGTYYYTGGGQFYSPQLVRSPSETSQTSSQGTGGGPSGNAIAGPSGSSGGLSPQSVANDYKQAVQVGTDVFEGASALGLTFGETPLALSLAIIAEDVDFLVNFFEDIFGGGGSPPTLRQLLHARHQLYPVILGVSDGLIPTEGTSADPPDPSDPSKPCPSCHCGCEHCHTEELLVTAYDNSFASTGKRPGQPRYGITSSGARAGLGTIAAPNRFSFFTGMYVPGYGCGTVLDRGGSIKGNHIDVWLPPPLSKNWGARSGVRVEVCDDHL